MLDPRDYRSFTSRRQHFDADTNGQDDLVGDAARDEQAGNHDGGESKAPHIVCECIVASSDEANGDALCGGGLFPTPTDYARFAQMLVNGGQLGTVRILSPSTVQLMTSNHLVMAEFFVGMIQRRDLGAMRNVQELARQMVYQALVHPEK